MPRFDFHLSIPAEDYLAYYRGAARQVLARTEEGTPVLFPAALLKPFVTPAGIHGDFVLTCDERNRGARLERR
ncbi:hypothetical protein GETHPA_19600 [Geothrix rubra]|uniref:DUF2835 domain-containing protein n=1 Tax=Geothrix rubra TaxID=2927977 RepID=A0ABQ5Q756_9BACT|nr:DUF2835 family protein [Geothrix rubra]GLH70427.1 hypothetical protein GETHPA_19600 [Geothrix rubra]